MHITKHAPTKENTDRIIKIIDGTYKRVNIEKVGFYATQINSGKNSCYWGYCMNLRIYLMELWGNRTLSLLILILNNTPIH